MNPGILISQLQSPSVVILEPKKIKSVTVSIVCPSICHEVIGPDAMIFIFWMLSFKSAFSLSSFTFIKRLFSCSLISAGRLVSFAYLRLLILLLAVLIPVCASSNPAFHMMYSASKVTMYSHILLSQLWASPLFMSGSNRCFLSCIQASQETGMMIWYSHVFKNFSVCCDPHSQRR